jgi:hypothetical protein
MTPREELEAAAGRPMTDDEVIIAIYSDGQPKPAPRMKEALPHRSPAGLGVRVSKLRARGLMPKPKYETAFADFRVADMIPEAEPSIRRAVREDLLRCPGCRKVFFPSDSLPIRTEAS